MKLKQIIKLLLLKKKINRMKISNEQLINLSVETESGQKLGKVQSFNIEIDSQSVLEYIIKPDNIIKDLIQKDLIISRGQILDISEKRILVADLNLKDKEKKLEKIKNTESISI